MVRYGGRASDTIRYACHRGMLDNGDPRCISFGGGTVDGAISTEILRVVRPGAVEAAIQAGSEALSQHDEILRALRLDVEAARYTANRAWKQYDAADPENRLVASELENRWNAALERVQELEERIEQHEREREHIVPPAPRSFAELSEDLGQVWRAPETDVRLKKRIVRTLIDEVIVDTDDVAHEISLVIHWKGGVHTELRLRRRRRGQNSAQTSQDVIEAVRALTLICPDAQIAGWLNRNGLRTGRGNRWTKERVTSLRSKREIPIHSPERRKAEGWLTLKEAAAYVRLTPKTLRRTVERGEINAMHPLREGPWIFKRDDLDQPRAHEILSRVRQRHGNPAGQDPGQLTLGQSTT